MFSNPNVHLPVGPVAVRQADGSISRIIPLDRHLIPMPSLVFPAWSWKASVNLADAFGHPEVALVLDRIEHLLNPARADRGGPLALSEADTLRLRALEAALPVVIEPVRANIAARWSPEFLLPCFGNFPSHGAVLREFRERNGRGEAYRAIGFVHSAAMTVELIEARAATTLEREIV